LSNIKCDALTSKIDVGSSRRFQMNPHTTKIAFGIELDPDKNYHITQTHSLESLARLPSQLPLNLPDHIAHFVRLFNTTPTFQSIDRPLIIENLEASQSITSKQSQNNAILQKLQGPALFFGCVID
jgi:hypothetical protein